MSDERDKLREALEQCKTSEGALVIQGNKDAQIAHLERRIYAINRLAAAALALPTQQAQPMTREQAMELMDKHSGVSIGSYFPWMIDAIIAAHAMGATQPAGVPREPDEEMLAVAERMRPPVGSPEQLAQPGYCERWRQRHRHNAIELWHAMHDSYTRRLAGGGR